MPRRRRATLSAKGAPRRKLASIKGFALNAADKINAWEDITSYNNYYEFSTDKSDPAENARNFKTEPWSDREASARKKGYEPRGRPQGETLEACLPASLSKRGR